MSIIILRIVCLIAALVACLAGLSEAAPIVSGDTTATTRPLSSLSSVDHSYGQVELLIVGNRAAHRGAEAEFRYSVSRNVDAGLERRGWVEDGSEYEVIERRSIGDFFRKIKEGFQHLGNKIKEGFHKVGEAFHHVGEKIKQGFQTAGQKIKEGFQTAGKKIKEGFQTAGAKIKQGFQVAGQKMKEGFVKAGHWIKETGAKVAKFGLKVVATVSAVASHIARFIPVIGAPLSTALKAHSFAMNKASDAIHADLGAKLNKGMHVMDIIQDPLGYAMKKGAEHVMNHVANHSRPSGPHAGPQHVPQQRPMIHSAPHGSVLNRVSHAVAHHAPPLPHHLAQAHLGGGGGHGGGGGIGKIAKHLASFHPPLPKGLGRAVRLASAVASARSHVPPHPASHPQSAPHPHAPPPHAQSHARAPPSHGPPPHPHAAPPAHHAPPPPHRAPPAAHHGGKH